MKVNNYFISAYILSAFFSFLRRRKILGLTKLGKTPSWAKRSKRQLFQFINLLIFIPVDNQLSVIWKPKKNCLYFARSPPPSTVLGYSQSLCSPTFSRFLALKNSEAVNNVLSCKHTILSFQVSDVHLNTTSLLKTRSCFENGSGGERELGKLYKFELTIFLESI